MRILWLSLMFFCLYSLVGSCVCIVSTKNPRSDVRLTGASSRGACILIDAENVRGKSGFDLSHAQLLDRTTLWSERRGLHGRVSIVVDHGSEHRAYWLSERGLTVVFGGLKLKADDIIARDVSFCQDTLACDVVVVTADRELIQRCRRAAARSGGPALQIVPPLNFLTDLESIFLGAPQPEEGFVEYDSKLSSAPLSEVAMEIEAKMELEIRLMGNIIEAESQLKKKGCSPKKRQKLTKKLRGLKEKLALITYGDSALKKVTAAWSSDFAVGDLATQLSRSEQNMLLARWEHRRGKSGRKEKTGDRVVLAERLRRQLEFVSFDAGSSCDAEGKENPNQLFPAKAHAEYVNSLMHSVSTANTKNSPSAQAGSSESAEASDGGKAPIRLVIVSDTHGYESSLSDVEPWILNTDSVEKEHRLDWKNEMRDDGNNGSGVSGGRDSRKVGFPDGDILLHLGDFAIDGHDRQRRDALAKFDGWLSSLPHLNKIVLRGNHDPIDAAFPLSKATYVTDPATLSFFGWKFSLIPFLNNRHLIKVPTGTDILATHVPPRAILDRCISGDLAGSAALRSGVEKMPGRPPLLWVCGHIHEGRGSRYVRFGGGRPGSLETLVLNAANANPGRATEIVNGPVVCELSNSIEDYSSLFEERVPHQPNQRVEWNNQDLSADSRVPNDVGQLLLAIDLGLRMGACLFDEFGTLLWYDQFQFSDSEELRRRASQLIKKLESDVNEGTKDCEGSKRRWVVTHVAVEGGDAVLLDAWRAAMEDIADSYVENSSRALGSTLGAGIRYTPRLLNLKAEEWRAELLTPKEKKSAATAKAAARLIARQFVCDCGKMDRHNGKFSTDAAEAVAVGYYMARRLGWLKREPAVRRSSNGIVLIPQINSV